MQRTVDCVTELASKAMSRAAVLAAYAVEVEEAGERVIDLTPPPAPDT
jgi:hypothetical protein